MKTGNITKTRIVNRLRDAFTHYRFLYNKEVNQNDNLNGILTEDDIKNDTHRFSTDKENIELQTPMIIYDCDKRQNNELTYLANTTLFHFLEFALQSSLMHEISEQTKEDDENHFENIGNAEREFIYIQNIMKDPSFFKKLDETTRKNRDLIKFALLCDWKNIEYVDKEIFEEDKKFLKECIDMVPNIYENLKGYYSDPEIFDYTLSRNGRAILYADKVFFTKDNAIKAIQKLKEDGDKYIINDIICNIPNEFFYDYEFAKKFSILMESTGFLQREIYSEIYSKLLNDEEVAIAVMDSYFENDFAKEMKENPRIIEGRIKYKEKDENTEIENFKKRRNKQKILETKKTEIYLKFLNASQKEKMRRIAARASISGVQSEGEVLLNATRDKEESEIGDNND